ncbi:hypothetical protein [Oceanibaculum nanhaiense]
MQRENLAPIDEAEAFAELARNGVALDDIAAETGKSVDTVKRRLAIAGLCDEVKQELSENRISLSVAEIMTLGSHDRQRGIDSATRNGVRGPSKGCLDRVRLLCRSLEKALLISLVAGPRNHFRYNSIECEI